MRMMQLSISAFVSLLAISAVPVSAHGPMETQEGSPTLHAAEDEKLGTYVVDGEGRALYLFESDERAEGDQDAVSNCYEECATAWPPLISEGTPEVDEELQRDLVGRIERTDGQMQVTYAGWPLYYYSADALPGHVRGHDIEHSGAEWYLITPEGEKIKGH